MPFSWLILGTARFDARRNSCSLRSTDDRPGTTRQRLREPTPIRYPRTTRQEEAIRATAGTPFDEVPLSAVNQPVPDRLRGQLYIASAATAWSIAGVMQRGLKIDTPTQASGRAFFAFLALAVVCGYEAQRDGQSVVASTRSIGRAGLAMAICLAAASASFIIALNNASVASVLFIQALAPLVAVVLSQIFLGERATRRTWTAMAMAVFGVAVMVGGPHLGSGIGLLFAFIMSFLFSVSIVLTRYARHVSLAPGSALSQLFVFVCALPFAHPTSIGSHDLWRLAVLGVFQMGLGQLCFVIGARLIAASETALLTLLEVVLGPVWVWLFYRENPGTATLIGGVLVLGAVTYQATERSRPKSDVSLPSAA